MFIARCLLSATDVMFFFYLCPFIGWFVSRFTQKTTTQMSTKLETQDRSALKGQPLNFGANPVKKEQIQELLSHFC